MLCTDLSNIHLKKLENLTPSGVEKTRLVPVTVYLTGQTQLLQGKSPKFHITSFNVHVAHDINKYICSAALQVIRYEPTPANPVMPTLNKYTFAPVPLPSAFLRPLVGLPYGLLVAW